MTWGGSFNPRDASPRPTPPTRRSDRSSAARPAEGFPRWIHWPPVYYFAYRTLMLLGEPETPGATERLLAIQQRGFLDEIAPSLRDSGLRSSMTAHPDLTGRQLTDAILRDAAKLGQLMGNDFVTER